VSTKAGQLHGGFSPHEDVYTQFADTIALLRSSKATAFQVTVNCI